MFALFSFSIDGKAINDMMKAHTLGAISKNDIFFLFNPLTFVKYEQSTKDNNIKAKSN